MEQNKKTRYRVPTVCTVCRRRKMKCDKERPHCTSCVKNKTTHLCHYEEQPWAADNEIQKLKDQIFQLQQQNNELKSLLNKRITAGSTLDGEYQSNSGVILPDQTANDPVLALTNDFDLLMLKEDKMSHYGSSSYIAVVKQDPILRGIFKRFLNQQNMGINFDKYFLYDQGIPRMTDHGCNALAPHSNGSVFEAELNKNHDELIDQINNMLPSREIFMALVEHFFAEAYAFVPFIDEVAFRKNIESLLSSTPEGKAFLVVQSLSQLVTVATLLCVLRFSFISLPMKKFQSTAHSEVVKKILDSHVQIPPTYIEFSKACMANASALRKPTLKHIQGLLMLRLYRFYAPEDGDESTDSTIFLALIVQMAKMHGLHRDPSKFQIVTDHRTANVWRKIWIQLMYLDATQALQFGCPLLIDDEYDTELPWPTSQDSAMEKSCIESMVKLNEVTQLMRPLLQASAKITEHPKRSDLEKCLKDVEFALQKYRTIQELTHLYSPMESFLAKTAKIKELTLKLNLYVTCSVFYYILMLTCDPGEIRSLQMYTLKAAECAFIVLRLCHDYARDPSRYNKTLNFESFFSASVFESSKRVLQQISSLTLRDMSGNFNLKKLVDGFSLPDSQGIPGWLTPINPTLTFGDQCLIRIQEYIQSCSKLSSRYFVCWRLVFVNKLLEDYIDEQYPGKFEDLHSKVQSYNAEQEKADRVGIDLDLSNVLTATEVENSANPEAVDFWQQLVDHSSQSKFDYLVPDLTKFEGFGDPFYDNVSQLAPPGVQQSFMFDSNEFPGIGGPSTFGSFSTDKTTSSVSDEISPKTDEMENPEPALNPGPPPKSVTSEHDIALQIAQSMFGGYPGSRLFDNDPE